MISFESLLLAANAAARGKRFKPCVARFFFHLERELLRLHDELEAKTYRPVPTARSPSTRARPGRSAPPRSVIGTIACPPLPELANVDRGQLLAAANPRSPRIARTPIRAGRLRGRTGMAPRPQKLSRALRIAQCAKA